jgi:uncharacterized protein (TIGR02266 family)
MPSRIRWTPEVARRVREFLDLNRRRIRESSSLSPRDHDRWMELRCEIEDAMNGPGARHGARRKALRVPSNLKVECAGSALTEQASTEQISEGGVFLVTERPLPVGTPLLLRLTGDRGETVEVEGAVVWVRRRESGGGPSGVGIEFSNLDASQREAVAYLVEEALAALDPAHEPS